MPSSPTASRTVLVLLLAGFAPAAQDDRPVRVFVLAGQSNMEGKAQNALLEHQAKDAATRALFAHLRRDGEWVVRDDVFVKFLDRRGRLTLGYGSPGRTGVELELGTVLGDRLADPVLLVKTAWGGHSLARQFRPPSAGMPADDKLAAELAQAQDRVRKRNEKDGRTDPLPTLEDIRAPYGVSYRAMVREVKDVIENLDTLFPDLAGHRPVLSGFVWFQGWNDQYEGFETEYGTNLAHLVRDVRRDLAAPALPFVVGVMGQNASQPGKGAMLAIQQAQLGLAEAEEFRDNVRAVRTDVLVDRAAEALYPQWRERPEEWNVTGSDHMYHYLGSAIWLNRIGGALADALLELLPQK